VKRVETLRNDAVGQHGIVGLTCTNMHVKAEQRSSDYEFILCRGDAPLQGAIAPDATFKCAAAPKNASAKTRRAKQRGAPMERPTVDFGFTIF